MVKKYVWIIEVEMDDRIFRYQSRYSAMMSEADIIKEEGVNRKVVRIWGPFLGFQVADCVEYDVIRPQEA